MPMRLLLGALLGAVTVAVGGVANAYWVGTGAGAGAAATATTAAVTLSPGMASSSLFPGGQADVVLNISNPNLSPVRVQSLALDTTQGSSGFAVDAGHTGCALSVLSLASQSNGGAGWTVPARVGGTDGTLSVTLTDALTMGTNATNACQGAMLTAYLTTGP